MGGPYFRYVLCFVALLIQKNRPHPRGTARQRLEGSTFGEALALYYGLIQTTEVIINTFINHAFD